MRERAEEQERKKKYDVSWEILRHNTYHQVISFGEKSINMYIYIKDFLDKIHSKLTLSYQ
jgi:hypothetical protein